MRRICEVDAIIRGPFEDLIRETSCHAIHKTKGKNGSPPKFHKLEVRDSSFLKRTSSLSLVPCSLAHAKLYRTAPFCSEVLYVKHRLNLKTSHFNFHIKLASFHLRVA